MADPIEFEIRADTRAAIRELHQLERQLHDVKGGADSAASGAEALGETAEVLGDTIGDTSIEAGRLADGLGAMIPIVGNLKTTFEGLAGSGLGAVAAGIGGLLVALPLAIEGFRALERAGESGRNTFVAYAGTLDDVIARMQDMERQAERTRRMVLGLGSAQEYAGQLQQLNQGRRMATENLRNALLAAGASEGDIGSLLGEAQRTGRIGSADALNVSLGGSEGRGIQALAARLAEFDDAIVTVTGSMERLQQVEEDKARAAGDSRKFASSRASARGGGSGAATGAIDALTRMEIEIENAVTDAFEDTLIAADAYYQERLKMEADFAAEKQEMIRQQVEAEKAAIREIQAKQAAAAKQEAQFRQDKADAIEASAEADRRMAIEVSETSIAAFDMIASNFAQNQGQMELFQGISDAAMAITKFAAYDYASGALYTVSAGLHFANAAQMGVGGGGSAASGGGGGAPPSRPVSSGGGSGFGGGGPQNVTININSPVTERDVGRMQRRAEQERARRFDARV